MSIVLAGDGLEPGAQDRIQAPWFSLVQEVNWKFCSQHLICEQLVIFNFCEFF